MDRLEPIIMGKKLLVIGLDGASFNVLDPLIEKGFLPNLAKLIEGGARADLETTFPPITADAPASLITGNNSGEHGGFQFVPMGKELEIGNAHNAPYRQGR